MGKSRAFTVFEFTVVLCTVFFLFGIFALYATRIIVISRQVALQSELMHLRTALAYYRILHSAYPAQLQDLASNSLTMPAAGGTIKFEKFVTPCRVNTKGFFLDPFMHPYAYDEKTGKLYSQTKGYERW